MNKLRDILPLQSLGTRLIAHLYPCINVGKPVHKYEKPVHGPKTLPREAIFSSCGLDKTGVEIKEEKKKKKRRERRRRKE